MLELHQKLKLYAKLHRKTGHVHVIICRLTAPTKVFLQLERHI